MNLRLDRHSQPSELGVLEEIYRTTPKPSAPRRTVSDYQAQVVILGLGAITLAVLALGWQQLRHDLIQPRNQLLAAATAIPPTSSDELAAATQDTDSDGLTDAEETDSVGSSPYLEDSDSDGVSDADEVIAKTNPNCAQGGLCELLPEAGAVLADDEVAPVAAATADSSLRAKITELGVPTNITQSLSDAELEQIFANVLATAPPAATPVDSEGSREVVSTQLREWLVQQGVDPKLLETISDAELVQLAEEAIAAGAQP